MAAGAPCDTVSLNHVVPIPNPTNDEMNDNKKQVTKLDNNKKTNVIDYWQRAQWLRAAVLGANDGLVSVASLMMGVGAVKTDITAMLVAGFAGLVAGACGMAIGEFVSVYTQYEVEVGQMKRDMAAMNSEKGGDENNIKDYIEIEMDKRRSIPNPLQAASASAFSFFVGGLVPLLSGAFVKVYKIRLIVIMAVASLALVVFGRVSAQLGKTPKVRSCTRFLIGGWMAMAITFGLTKLLAHSSGLDV